MYDKHNCFMKIPNFEIFRGRDLLNGIGEADQLTIFAVTIPFC